MSTDGFIYLGASLSTNKSNHAISVPYPTQAPFVTTRMVDSGRNSNGAMVGRMVGRAMDKISMTWAKIECEKWWGMNRWFNSGHFTFYCHFFNHNLGYWQTRLYYISDIKVEPHIVSADTGKPAYYRNASFSVIDCGVD